jgi:hypothetical protein
MNEFSKLDQNERRQTILEVLGNFDHPLIIADSYENISEGLISGSPTDDEKKISNFLEQVPSNTAVILTSRHKNNLLGERVYSISGLNKIDGRNLFITIAKKHFHRHIFPIIIITKIFCGVQALATEHLGLC